MIIMITVARRITISTIIIIRTPAASHRRPLEIINLWIDPLELGRVDRLLGRRIRIRR